MDEFPRFHLILSSTTFFVNDLGLFQIIYSQQSTLRDVGGSSDSVRGISRAELQATTWLQVLSLLRSRL
jgi:hypothetical protein